MHLRHLSLGTVAFDEQAVPGTISCTMYIIDYISLAAKALGSGHEYHQRWQAAVTGATMALDALDILMSTYPALTDGELANWSYILLNWERTVSLLLQKRNLSTVDAETVRCQSVAPDAAFAAEMPSDASDSKMLVHCDSGITSGNATPMSDVGAVAAEPFVALSSKAASTASDVEKEESFPHGKQKKRTRRRRGRGRGCNSAQQ